MSTTPSLVDVYHHPDANPPHTGVMRVFVGGFGHDLHFRPKAAPDAGLELAIDAVELEAAHLGALLQALTNEEIAMAPTGGTTESAFSPEATADPITTAPTVQLIRHTTHSGLLTGVLRLHAGTFRETDLPYHEHVSRNGRFVVQLHRIRLDAPLLQAIVTAILTTERELERGRASCRRAASNLMASVDLGIGGALS
jgi:hypothetical protein